VVHHSRSEVRFTAAETYEGAMTVILNPRLSSLKRSAKKHETPEDEFPDWFASTVLLSASLAEAGLPPATIQSLFIEIRNGAAEIVFKPERAGKRQVELLFAALFNNAEKLASTFYAPLAADIIAWHETPAADGERGVQNYVHYRWAVDFRSGADTALKTLYPPLVFQNSQQQRYRFPAITFIIIIFAFFFLAALLALCLNGLAKIRADGPAMAKIRGALGK
jgi:hypothetical protein